MDDEEINRRDACLARENVLAVGIERGHGIRPTEEGRRVASARDDAGHFIETERGHEGGGLGNGGVAPTDDGLRGDDGWFRLGGDADDADVVAEDVVEKGDPFEVFERRRLPDERQAEVSLRAFSDVEVRADGEAEVAGDFEIHLRFPVEIDRVLCAAARDAAQIAAAIEEGAAVSRPSEDGVAFVLEAFPERAATFRRIRSICSTNSSDVM